MEKKKIAAEISVQPREWYYLSGTSPVGPYTYLEMIRLLQTKNISENALVWMPGMNDWKPVLAMPVFHGKELELILKSGIPGAVNYFTNRNFHRIPYNAKFVLHNEESLWKGVSFELGAGGIGMMVNSDQLQPGQEVFVHKTSRGGVISINAIAEVASKLTNNMRPGQARYGLEFTDISKEDREKIEQFVENYSETKKIA